MADNNWLDLCAPMVKYFEGCVLTAYPDPATKADPWTIGYGHTGTGIVRGLKCTQAQADAWLASDLQKFANNVDTYVTVPLSAQQKAALVSFVYNCGPANLKTSTLLRKLNARDYKGAAEEFPRWNRAAGKVMTGLTRRRAAERALFLTGEWK